MIACSNTETESDVYTDRHSVAGDELGIILDWPIGERTWDYFELANRGINLGLFWTGQLGDELGIILNWPIGG